MCISIRFARVCSDKNLLGGLRGDPHGFAAHAHDERAAERLLLDKLDGRARQQAQFLQMAQQVGVLVAHPADGEMRGDAAARQGMVGQNRPSRRRGSGSGRRAGRRSDGRAGRQSAPQTLR